MALTSSCIFIATAQPFGTGSGVPSDGGRLWALIRKKEESRAEAALLALEALMEGGIRPRDWDPALVVLAGQVSTPPAYGLSSATMMLRNAEDRSDLAEARRQIDRIRQMYPRVPRWLRADAAAETAFWLAHFQNDASSALEFLRDARGPLVAAHRRFRAEAALLLKTGDKEGAKAVLDRATASLGGGLGQASALDMDLIQEIRRTL